MKSFFTFGVATLGAFLLLAAGSANADCIPGFSADTLAECNKHCDGYTCVSSGGPYQCGYCDSS